MPKLLEQRIFRFRILLICVLLLGISRVSAQRVLMENYTMENGLATNVVYNIYQDSKGFMWFMTRFGLSRYDGARFTNFTTKDGLHFNFVSAMFEDSDGMLYVASGDKLQTIKNGKVGPDILKEPLAIEAFFEQPDGNNILTTDNSGLVRYSQGKISPITSPYPGPNSSLVRTQSGKLLTGGHFVDSTQYVSSLKLFDSNGKLLGFAPPGEPSEVQHLFLDIQGNIWVCAVNGLSVLSMEDVDEGLIRFCNLPTPFDHAILSGNIQDMLQDRYGNYWIATNEGLVRIGASGQLTVFTETDGLASNKVLKLYEDQGNNLWVGTLKGVTKISLGGQLQYFTTQDGLADNEIQSVLVLNEEEIFLTTTNGHLQKFNPLTMSVITLATVKPNSFFKILTTHTGEYFVALNEEYRWTAKKLFKFDPKKGLKDEGIAFDHSFFSMETDGRGHYLMAGNYGLHAYETKTKKQFNLAGITERVNQIVFDKEGNLWAGMWDGKLYRVELFYEGDSIKAKKDDLTHLMKGARTSLVYVDAKGNVWAGSRDKGVTKIFKNANGGYESLHMTPEDGIMAPSCYVAAEDDLGSIFIASQLGLDKLLPVGDSYKVLNFSKENNFYDEIWDVKRTDDSIFWVATASGLVRFVDQLTETLPPPTVHITQIINKAESESINLDPTSSETAILSHDQGNLQFYFAALYFVNESAVRYSYRLLGASDENWNSLANGTTVSYAGLRPGKYRFEVRTLNWNDIPGTSDVFDFEITPPWWTTWWFLTLTFMIIAGVVYYFMKRRIDHIRFKAQMEQKVTETEMKALRAQMNPHFIFNCINNIDALVQSNDRYNATVYLNKFAKLLRNVLDSSQQRTVSLSKDMETLELYVSLEQLRDKDKYEVSVQLDRNLLNGDFQVPPLIIQPLVENAIVHGLRKKRGRDGKLEISVSGQHPYVKYVIEDNGVGRNAPIVNQTKGHRSYGTQMSSDRIRFFNDEDKASIVILDKEENGVALGTRVEVLLKVE
ncbi:MAG: two-component regulator propeller domain-containing protein [Bacteroidota bacterium]|nr:two-component regulator propeller domain-containing protein [Bacteroidota bacterium]